MAKYQEVIVTEEMLRKVSSPRGKLSWIGRERGLYRSGQRLWLRTVNKRRLLVYVVKTEPYGEEGMKYYLRPVK